MSHALQINADMTVASVELPDEPALRQRAIAARLSGAADQAVYHRQALMWVHGNGAREGLPANLVATAVASAWRGLDVGASYFLHGRVLVTGAANGDAGPLEEKLVGQVCAVAAAVTAQMAAFRTSPPASNEAAWGAIVQRAFEAVASLKSPA
ncbi:hypothetical protein [Streptomyces sp. NRRL B-24484]|uniref:hypothetical protein n=1 Tax=Streptomyces sp. NRRL B-24484 TaxID=1463833 RepID=UPI0004BEB7C4|nr:hypothetical protein [Streptomyces sp. NRRL B-24484]